MGPSCTSRVGSNSNAGENGMIVETDRASIWQIDPHSGAHRLFATGLRNPNGMAWEPDTGRLWTVVNERDEIGSDLVPDYLTAVQDGGFYGWPYSYFGAHPDDRVQPQRPDLVASAIVPDYALGPHTASLGLCWSNGNALPRAFAQGMFVSQHGSWNRKPRSGYKVIFIPFSHGKPSGMPRDVLTGFVSADGKAYGRPVGVAIDKRGGLLVADDVGNVIWRVSWNDGAGSHAQSVDRSRKLIQLHRAIVAIGESAVVGPPTVLLDRDRREQSANAPRLPMPAPRRYRTPSPTADGHWSRSPVTYPLHDR